MASDPIILGKTGGEKVKPVADFVFLGSKITADATKLKDACFLEGKL